MFKIPRGTRDFASSEMNNRNYVENIMRNTFVNYGYKEIQTPMFENLELFTAKSGDSIIDEIYSFQDKGGRDLALRPELTAPVMRFYVESMQMEPKPLKLFYFGSCFRYDRPQKGRYREFMQAGCEIIGTDTPEAYAELIAMAYEILKNTGLKEINLNIGNLNILSYLFEKLNLAEDKRKYLVPLIDKSEFDDVYSALVDFNISPKDATDFLKILQTDRLEEILDYIKENKDVEKEIKDLEKIMTLLKKSFKVENLQVKMSIVRGLDYYKGIVFEIEAPKLGAEKQLCGGGAYELVKLFGGREIPTAGFAIGFDRTIVALDAEGYSFPKTELDVYIVPFNEDTIDKSIEIAQKLRTENFSTDIDLLRRGIGKALKYASSVNARKAIILGPDELKKDSVSLKDMKTGEQKTVKIKDVTKYLK